MAESIRLQKWLAQANLCSRREGERWIDTGRVAVNGVVVTHQGVVVAPTDVIEVDGKPVLRDLTQPMVVVALHKPSGVLCTRKDPEGRKTIYEYMDPRLQHLHYVGRLDINSEGIILFTNDGQLVHHLTHPSRRIPRIYRVRVHGRVDSTLLESLKEGVTLEDGHTGPLDVILDRSETANSWLTLTLYEGRNRMVRRIFDTLDMKVARLIRTSFGQVSLGEMPKGHWRPLSRAEVNLLRRISGTPTPREEVKQSHPKQPSPPREEGRHSRPRRGAAKPPLHNKP